jgi:hypothetical protein
MDGGRFEELQMRLSRLEDQAAITQLILSYGPAADAGLASFAGQLWLEDGIYDWDAKGEAYQGCTGVEAMLESDGHQGLMARGVAHFGGPPVIDIDGDQATALNYSLIMRNEGDRFYLWRVSGVRWDLERVDSRWRVRRRSNRLLDASGGGSRMFRDTLRELFEEASR